MEEKIENVRPAPGRTFLLSNHILKNNYQAWLCLPKGYCCEHASIHILPLKMIRTIYSLTTTHMKGFVQNIEQLALKNTNFRKVLYTGKHSQLVVMSLLPNEDIGLETHHDTDQFFRCEKGEGKCSIDGNEYTISDGFAIIIPAGAQHNISNTSSTEPLQPLPNYPPAHHKDGTIHVTKAEAQADKEAFDGKTTE